MQDFLAFPVLFADELCRPSSLTHSQVKYLGFDHFTIYDTDGSGAAYLLPLLNSTFLTYFNRWAPTPCLQNLTATRKHPPNCYETLLNNQCLWTARGTSEWTMLIHAPDCFVNDAPGLPKLFGLLDSMDHSKSSLLLPTYLFEFPSSDVPMLARNTASRTTAADLFTIFNRRVCPMLNSYRHMPVIDPHMIHVSRVHEALDDFNLEARMYTASIAVNHYIQIFSDRTARQIGALSIDGMQRHPNGSVDYCTDDGMSHVSEIVSSMLEVYAASK
jgi:hypothetical protein